MVRVTATGAIDNLTAQSEAAVLALWKRLAADQLTEEQFVTLAAAEVARSNARAVSLADLAVAMSVTVQTGRATAPVGLPIIDHQARLRAALRTVLRDDIASVESAREKAESIAARLGRLARAEPARVAQSAMHQAMGRHPSVGGWVRGLSAKPCGLCRQWADGVVRSNNISMNRHAGCSCVPQPVLSNAGRNDRPD